MKEAYVSKGTYKVSKDEEMVLVAPGLGSSLALCVRDASTGVFGLWVMVVPTLREGSGDLLVFDVSRGLKLFFQALTKEGVKRDGLSCWIAGVAQFLECPKELNMGLQLYSLVKKTLEKNGIKVEKEFVGGPYNRTVRFGLISGPDVSAPGETRES